jgi:hypothetical protein
MAEPADMILPLLRDMRVEIGARFDRVDARFDLIERRLKALDETQASYRQALTADSLLSKLVTRRIRGAHRSAREEGQGSGDAEMSACLRSTES